VIKPEKDADPNTIAIRALNRKLRDDKRISLSMLPLGDGVTLAWKRH
jgi:predicted O-methyltransferase YrrM